MSWTVQQTGENQSSIKKLEDAINEATRANILLFCSANDQGAHKDKCYPINCDSKKIFRIGAATATGDKWKWIGEGQVDFIFPGDKVFIQPQHDSLIQKCRALSGSSIATAIAAGLAALILYIVQADNHRNFRPMLNYERMETAFKEPGTSGNIPYILVWDLFRTKFPVGDGSVEENEGKVFEWVAGRLGPKYR
jgi:subtilisin family serine protease